MENNPLSQITHEEARRLTNFKIDQPLDANTLSMLNSHLNGCAECRTYASELDEVENILRNMKHRLDLRPTPLHLDQIITSRGKNKVFGFANSMMIVRTATMVLAVIAVVLGAWQFSMVNVASPTAPSAIIPIPTPSIYLTSANGMPRNCDYVLYQVQAGDTLDGIASQFSVPKETIMEFNGMKGEKIDPAMQIRIPTCDHTPTATVNTPTTTITITPQFNPITVTPG
jgi:hypothetical protein